MEDILIGFFLWYMLVNDLKENLLILEGIYKYGILKG